jgi:PKD repeat protein
VAANASTAQVTGVGQSLGGKLKFTATDYYAGGANGKLSGDFWVEFVGKGRVHPFAAGNVPGFLQKPGFKPPNQHPTADFTTSQDSGVLEVSFDGSSSSDPDGSVASYTWDFHDGSDVAHGATPTHTYATAGTKSVTLQVTDNEGATDSLTKDVIVTPNQEPTADFSCFQDDPDLSTDVSCSANDSFDLDGEIVEYTWDFGDGSPVSHESDPVHTYPDPPTGSPYTVTLTVKDNGGATDTTTRSVPVTAPGGP